MRSFWVTWHSPNDTPFVMMAPWWSQPATAMQSLVSGAVRAESEDSVRDVLRKAYEEAGARDGALFEVVSIVEKPETWTPYRGEYKKANWMPDWPVTC